MITKLRQRRAAFLSAILICLVAVNVHALAHLDAGSVECEFCSTHNDPLDVIVAGEPSRLLMMPAPKPFERQLQQVLAEPFYSVHQRGPPLAN